MPATNDTIEGRDELASPRLPLAVAWWLFAVCLCLALMVVVGGATRLTHSGLSITEWRPVTGAVPPLSHAAWAEAFAKYQQIPQFRLRDPDMTLAQFQSIYWWEWGHRLLGRIIGFVFLLPLLWFAWRRAISRPLAMRLGVIFVLGGAQGALGWWMVASGLVDRLDVSQYRLAAHLGLAFVIFGLTFWTALECLRSKSVPLAGQMLWLRPVSLALVALVFVQVLLGALVAGTHAGFLYNTWPLIDGAFWPRGLLANAPWFVNFGENQLTVQFDHRLGAYAVTLLVAAIWLLARPRGEPATKRALDILGGLVLLQMALGIETLLHVVPLPLGLLHQAGALALFAGALNLAQIVRTKTLGAPGALAFP